MCGKGMETGWNSETGHDDMTWIPTLYTLGVTCTILIILYTFLITTL